MGFPLLEGASHARELAGLQFLGDSYLLRVCFRPKWGVQRHRLLLQSLIGLRRSHLPVWPVEFRIGTATASGVFGAVADLGNQTGETPWVSVAQGLAAKRLVRPRMLSRQANSRTRLARIYGHGFGQVVIICNNSCAPSGPSMGERFTLRELISPPGQPEQRAKAPSSSRVPAGIQPTCGLTKAASFP
jgi:hypothetical protein